jgi:hypothetical protein
METKRKVTCGVVVVVVLLIVLLAILLILRQCESEEQVSTGQDTETSEESEETDEPTETEEEIEEVVDMVNALFVTYDFGTDADMTDVLPVNSREAILTSTEGVTYYDFEAYEEIDDMRVTPEQEFAVGVVLNRVGRYRNGESFMAVGPAGWAATSDDGKAWTQVDTGSTADYWNLHSWGDHVWLCGDGVRYSMDSGASWMDLFAFAGQPNLYYAIQVEEDFSGWAVGDAVVSTTGDGGFSGQDIEVPNEIYYALTVREPGEVFIVGAGGAMQTSQDGGATWVPVESGTTDDLLGIAFLGDDLGVMVSRTGSIHASSDAGQTWTERTYRGGPYDFNAVSISLVPAPAEGELPELVIHGPSDGGKVVFGQAQLDEVFGGLVTDEDDLFERLDLKVDWN